MRKAINFWVVALAGLLILSAQPSQASTFTLTDLNSEVYFDTESQAGVYGWVVDGVDHLYQQWFWFRIGADGPEYSLDTLNLVSEIASDANFNDGDDTLVATYNNAQIQIVTRFSLTGGSLGSRTSSLAEQITISNLTDAALDVHFFQYNDFDLNETSGDDTGLLANAQTMRQLEARYVFNEVSVTPAPNRWEMDGYANILNRLNDDYPTILANQTSPYSGDVTWAFQWDFTLGAGEDAQISKNKYLAPMVPIPAAVWLLAGGLIGLVGLRRKFR